MTHLRPRPPSYEVFMTPLAVELDPSEFEQVQFAYFASKYGHQGQTRDDGSRYFDHPKSVAWTYINEFGGRDVRIICALLLHDMGEDAYLLSPYRMKVNFGIDCALDVSAMTKLPKGKESTEKYLQRVIGQGPWAIAGKLFDRLDNVRDLAGCTPEKRAAQIAETQKYHLRLLVPALAEHGGEWAEMSIWHNQKILEAIASH